MDRKLREQPLEADGNLFIMTRERQTFVREYKIQHYPFWLRQAALDAHSMYLVPPMTRC